MRAVFWYFVLSAVNWVVVCWVGWSWVLGFDLPAWKMVAMACLAAFIQTAFVPIHMALRKTEPKGKEPTDRELLMLSALGRIEEVTKDNDPIAYGISVDAIEAISVLAAKEK